MSARCIACTGYSATRDCRYAWDVQRFSQFTLLHKINGKETMEKNILDFYLATDSRNCSSILFRGARFSCIRNCKAYAYTSRAHVPKWHHSFSLVPSCFIWQPYHRRWIQIVAMQVVAWVVIRTTKLKFVAESRTHVYLSQHVPTTCNTEFCCETSCYRRW